jgi:hypothetical protein
VIVDPNRENNRRRVRLTFLESSPQGSVSSDGS